MFLIIFIIIVITPFSDFLLKRSINNQISYLTTEFENGLGGKLQNRYPEGKMFSNLLFALSLIKYSESSDKIQPILIEEAILRTTSESAKSNFTKDLSLRYGAFYNGWLNFTLKKYIKSNIFKKSVNKEVFQKLYRKITFRITEIQKDSIKLIETYSNSIWPADNLACIASLDIDAKEIKEKWLNRIINQSESEYNLINHNADIPNEIRGSSQALITYFFDEIDKELAISNFSKYNELFIDEYLGISLVKEFVKGEGIEDVDSGPIILGYGSVATIMNAKVIAKLNTNKAKITWSFLNVLGVPISLFGKKYYLLKQEPMYDIFLLWISVDLL